VTECDLEPFSCDFVRLSVTGYLRRPCEIAGEFRRVLCLFPSLDALVFAGTLGTPENQRSKTSLALTCSLSA
jgi:hypothetical protein